MIVSAIAAYSKNRVIGLENQLPWHLPADMHYFMRTTKGHHVLMGRKTFESLGLPLKNRINVVITTNPFFVASGVIITHSIEEGLALARENGEEEVFIIGGAQIYEQSLAFLDKLYLTEIDIHIPDGDAYFPPFDEAEWDLETEESHSPDEKNAHAYVFKVFKKKGNP